MIQGRKICGTIGCCNPFHYTQKVEDTLLPGPPPEAPQLIPLDSYLEMVRYYSDKVSSKDFNILRSEIPSEDISDELLTLAIEKLT